MNPQCITPAFTLAHRSDQNADLLVPKLKHYTIAYVSPNSGLYDDVYPSKDIKKGSWIGFLASSISSFQLRLYHESRIASILGSTIPILGIGFWAA